MAFEQTPQATPWKGIIKSSPAPYETKQAFWDDLFNIWPYFGRMRTRPRLQAAGQSPNGETIWNMIPFLDGLGNLHDLVLTTTQAYMLTPGVTVPVWNGPLNFPAWDSTLNYILNDQVTVGGVRYVAIQAGINHAPATSPTFWQPLDSSPFSTAVPYGYAIAQGRVYFSNGSAPGAYADGESTIKSMRHPGSFRYCGILASHMITANTTEPAPGMPNSTRFPSRVRWSASGDPTSWEESAGSSAGHEDLLEVPDIITGYCTLSRTGFVAHPHGWTMMTPTGLGSRAFQFDTVTHAQKGIGVYYPPSLDVFGSIACFVAEEDVYLFDGSSFTPIGGDMKTRIFTDIQAASAETILGSIIARFNTQWPMLSYWLSIPAAKLDQEPITWIYHWDSQSWSRFRSPVGRQTAIANLVI